jgi:hypothetical protein
VLRTINRYICLYRLCQVANKMKKLIYIAFIFAFMVAFTSCEKEVLFPLDNGGDAEATWDEGGTRGGELGGSLGGVTDPDEDEDFDEEDDTVVDPDEDEDFDEADEKGATKPGSETPGK